MHSAIHEIMNPSPVLISPEASLQMASNKIKSSKCGFLLVGTRSHPLGMITEHDIVIGAAGQDFNPSAEKVRDHMSCVITSCSEDDYLEDAIEKLRLNEAGSIFVRDRQGRISGVLSLSNLLKQEAGIQAMARAIGDGLAS